MFKINDLRKRVFIACTCAVLITAPLTACGKTDVKKAGGEAIIFDQKDQLPDIIAKDSSHYYVLTARHTDQYYSDEYKLWTGEDLRHLSDRYSAHDVAISNLCAGDGYAAWVEQKYDSESIQYAYRIYESKTATVKTIWKTPDSEEGDDTSQNSQMSIYKSTLYYAQNDYKKKKARLIRYDLKRETSKVLYETALRANDLNDYGFTALDITRGGILTAYAVSDHNHSLLRINLNSGKEQTVKIPEKVNLVHAVSYDEATGMTALYYEAEGTTDDCVGVFTNKDRKIKKIYTFGDSGWAYQYNIKLNQGHLYWADELSIRGDTTDPDHHWAVDYNCKTDQYTEYKHAFRSTLIEDRIYLLVFEDGIDKIRVQILNRH